MAISLVQSANSGSVIPASSHSCPITTTAGHGLVVTGRFFNSAGTMQAPGGISDTAGNTWHVSTVPLNGSPPDAYIPFQTSNSIGSFIGWSLNAASVTSVTVAAPTGMTYDGGEFSVSEWSGILAVGAGATTQSQAGAEVVGPAMNVSAGNLLVAACEPNAAVSVPTGATAITSNTANVFVYEIPAGSGTLTWDWLANTQFTVAAQVFSATAPSAGLLLAAWP